MQVRGTNLEVILTASGYRIAGRSANGDLKILKPSPRFYSRTKAEVAARETWKRQGSCDTPAH